MSPDVTGIGMEIQAKVGPRGATSQAAERQISGRKSRRCVVCKVTNQILTKWTLIPGIK